MARALGAEERVHLGESEGAAARPPCPRPAAAMLSRLLKEHQAKQNERKELQGEPGARLRAQRPAA